MSKNGLIGMLLLATILMPAEFGSLVAGDGDKVIRCAALKPVGPPHICAT